MTEIKKLIEQGKFKEAETLVVESKVSKKTEEAINCGEALLLSGYEADASLYFMLGTCYSWIEQYDKAIEAYNQVIKLKPDYANLSEEDKRVVRRRYNEEKYEEANKSWLNL